MRLSPKTVDVWAVPAVLGYFISSEGSADFAAPQSHRASLVASQRDFKSQIGGKTCNRVARD
jgi:hypothetical protein